MAIHLETIQQAMPAFGRDPIQEQAWERLKELGWPRARHENWTYFPLSLFNTVSLPTLSQKASPIPFQWSGDFGSESDLSGLLPLVLGQGSQVYTVAPHTNSEQELALPFTEPFAHMVLQLGPHSKTRILVPRAQGSDAFKAQRIDIFCGEGSELEWVSLGDTQTEPQLALRHVCIHQESQSQTRILELHSGPGAFRSSMDVSLEGVQASCEYRALSVVSGHAQSHRHFTIKHLAPECTSEQWVRHILSGHSHSSFDGSVIVSPHTPNTLSKQLINSLLLSPHAKASTKPNLKIYHDNVECAHGSTCSDLDSTALFYLESRGLSPTAARRLLTNAFANELALAHPAGVARTAYLDLVQQELSKVLE